MGQRYIFLLTYARRPKMTAYLQYDLTIHDAEVNDYLLPDQNNEGTYTAIYFLQYSFLAQKASLPFLYIHSSLYIYKHSTLPHQYDIVFLFINL